MTRPAGFPALLIACLLLSAMVHAQSSWTAGPEMPTHRSEMAAVGSDGKIYVAGGINFWGSTKAFECYDIAQGTWEKLPNLPKAINHEGLAALNGKIYLTGGFRNMIQSKTTAQCWVYDPAIRLWEAIAPMPAPRAAHSMVEHAGLLHVLGGQGDRAREVWTYDRVRNAWQTDVLPPLPAARDHISALVVDGSIVVVAGRHAKQGQPACWVAAPGAKQWTAFTEIPLARGGQTAAYFGGKIHVCGGEDLATNTTMADHHAFDFSTGAWESRPPLPTARHGLVSVVHEGKWYVIGGGKKASVATVWSASGVMEVYSADESN